MKFGVVVFPGSNCDHDCHHVLSDVYGKQTEMLWHQSDSIKNVDCIVLPGGFSYGDYLRCGAIARFSPLMKEVIKFANDGGPVIGICNGFQILLESGLLPGAMKQNKKLSFICKYTHLRVDQTDTAFTSECKPGQVLAIPVAHGEGNYFADEQTIKELKDNNQIVFRYCDENANATPESNPNGSVENIAGICNKARNVVGMMPHPERCAEDVFASSDGRFLFDSIIKNIESGKLV